MTSSEIENGGSFATNQVFQSNDKSHGQVQPKSQACCNKRYVYEKQTNISGAHPQLIGQTRANIKSVSFKKMT